MGELGWVVYFHLSSRQGASKFSVAVLPYMHALPIGGDVFCDGSEKRDQRRLGLGPCQLALAWISHVRERAGVCAGLPLDVSHIQSLVESF